MVRQFDLWLTVLKWFQWPVLLWNKSLPKWTMDYAHCVSSGAASQRLSKEWNHASKSSETVRGLRGFINAYHLLPSILGFQSLFNCLISFSSSQWLFASTCFTNHKCFIVKKRPQIEDCVTNCSDTIKKAIGISTVLLVQKKWHRGERYLNEKKREGGRRKYDFFDTHATGELGKKHAILNVLTEFSLDAQPMKILLKLHLTFITETFAALIITVLAIIYAKAPTR